MWHVTCGTWHMTRDMWHVTRLGGWTFSQNFSSLALTVCDLWYYEDLEEMDDSVNELITRLFVGQSRLHRVCQKILPYIPAKLFFRQLDAQWVPVLIVMMASRTLRMISRIWRKRACVLRWKFGLLWSPCLFFILPLRKGTWGWQEGGRLQNNNVSFRRRIIPQNITAWESS